LDNCVVTTDLQYCCEVGDLFGCRSRYYGELTSGSGSLRELLPDAKSLFYIKKMLKQQQLIKSQVAGTLLSYSCSTV